MQSPIATKLPEIIFQTVFLSQAEVQAAEIG